MSLDLTRRRFFRLAAPVIVRAPSLMRISSALITPADDRILMNENAIDWVRRQIENDFRNAFESSIEPIRYSDAGLEMLMKAAMKVVFPIQINVGIAE